MKSLLHPLARLSFFILFLFAFSCQKDTSLDDQNEEVYAVSFKFSGFTDHVSSLKPNVKSASKLLSSSGNSQNFSEGYLYYWSFNDDNLLPDIRYNTQLQPTITYANGDTPNSFVHSTYVYENFAAGKAITFAGAKDILIKMPIQEVIELKGLGFDVGSPGTGPKDFEIQYSVNKGQHYDMLSFNNQFGNTNTANQKHTYSYDLTDKNIKAEELWVMITPKAGERGASGIFNEHTGALRMDNLYLTGIAPIQQSSSTINKIHYFLFNKDKPKLVIYGAANWNANGLIDISIPIGNYDICFLTNTSNADLLLPSNPTKTTLYAGSTFSNAKADIFGFAGELVVSQAQTKQITLERLFSQVKIEFTDAVGLDLVTKIVVDQQHDPFFFAPYNTMMSNPLLDQSSIEVKADFAANKQLQFNQFLGLLALASPVTYNVYVYGSAGLLRTINLSSSLRNNMQLVFRGNILDGIEQNTRFSILKNENWNGEQTTEF